MSFVAFATSAGANGNGSGWGDFEKPLNMLLEEELEMWKEKQNDSMDEGAQEDEQFEREIDNEETGRSGSSFASENTRMMMSAGSAEVIQIELNGYQVLWSKDNKQRTKYVKCAIDKASKIKFCTRGIGHEKKRV